MNEPRIQSVRELAVRVADDSALADKIKADPVAALSNLAGPLQTDVWIYRCVVRSLGLTVLLVVIGVIVLACMGKSDPPQALTALGSAALGALAGLLAPSPATR